MIKQLILIAWVGLAVASLGCKGSKGDIGPAGPAGPTGQTGAIGDTGVAGTDALGAKVITTGAVRSDGGGYTFGISKLTPADTVFLSTCGVFVYIKSQTYWHSIPGVVPFGTDSTTFNFKYALRNATNAFIVNIRPITWTEDQPTAPERQFEAIRVILVPTEAYGRINSSVNMKNYDEAVKALGLSESDVQVIK